MCGVVASVLVCLGVCVMCEHIPGVYLVRIFMTGVYACDVPVPGVDTCLACLFISLLGCLCPMVPLHIFLKKPLVSALALLHGLLVTQGVRAQISVRQHISILQKDQLAKIYRSQLNLTMLLNSYFLLSLQYATLNLAHSVF